MTLDELVDIFNREAKLPSIRKADIEGIAAVVRALRDHMYDTALNFSWNAGEIEDAFNEILGSDAGEKAAGEEAVSGVRPSPQSSVPASAPAADFIDFVAQLPDAADPKVCRWMGTVGGVFWYAHGMGRKLESGQTHCDDCGGMIRLEPHKPAADPKVCVWTRTSKWTDTRRGCDGSLAFWDNPYAPDKCSRCDKPIKFQEQP